MNRTMAIGVVLLTVAVPILAAQDGPPRGERLRAMIEERFGAQVQAELGLTDDQAARVRQLLTASAERRRQLETEERAAQRALRDQLRPGVAAQTDSVTRLLDRLMILRVNYAQAAKEEIRELGAVLTPVQQAQFLLMRDRIWARAQEIRMQRRPGDGHRTGIDPS